MNPLYWFIHLFTGCPEENKIYYKNHASKCDKCGRIEFYFTTY